MEFDYEVRDEKKKEIKGLIETYIQTKNVENSDIDKISSTIMTKCVNVSPPEKPKMILHLITMHPSGRGGAHSTKPGNIQLNIGKLYGKEGVRSTVDLCLIRGKLLSCQDHYA